MNVGMIGLGKLGLPVAVAFGQVHDVYGYDLNPALMSKRKYEHKELGPSGQDDFQTYFDGARLGFFSLEGVASACEVIFVAVQTPHDPLYEGVTVAPDNKKDFDYGPLESAVKALSEHLTKRHVVAVISTVLPGTMRRLIEPLLAPSGARLVYNPSFIAMGTVMQDFLDPEFVLLGSRNTDDTDAVAEIYNELHNAIHLGMNVESAELAKVAYNTFIGMKITFANTVMEICHKTPGCEVDDVMGVIKSAKKRLISTKYLNPGMGDGGGCHPRDCIAMSKLAERLDLSHDIFNDLTKAREDQTRWLAELVFRESSKNNWLPVYLLGRAFKPETHIATGSPAVLLQNMLEGMGISSTCSDDLDGPKGPAVYFISTKHARFAFWKFQEGSVVIDPHGYINDQAGVKVIRIGRG
jgi:UDPglucose 6-dehydrogenase